jgi:hypothetical protein
MSVHQDSQAGNGKKGKIFKKTIDIKTFINESKRKKGFRKTLWPINLVARWQRWI